MCGAKDVGEGVGSRRSGSSSCKGADEDELAEPHAESPGIRTWSFSEGLAESTGRGEWTGVSGDDSE